MGRIQAKGILNRKLMRIFGPKRDENGEWIRLHQDEIHSLYRWKNKSRGLRWAGHVPRLEQDRSPFKIVTGKRPLEKPR